MAQERKGSVVMQGTLRDILTVIEKKIRNLEKRKTRLEQVEKDLEMGKEVGENQRAALSKKDQVSDMLEVCRDFLQTAEQLARNDEAVARARAKREQREANQRTIDTLGKVMRLQFLLSEGLRREESEDDNRALEALRQTVDEASGKDFGKSAELWINVLEAKPKEFAPGVTFEAVHQKLSSMGELLAKLNEVSLCAGGPETAAEDAAALFGGVCDARGDSPLSAEGMMSDTEQVATGVEAHQSEEPSPMHHVGSAGDQHQQLPLEHIDSATAETTVGVQQIQHQIHDPQMASNHHPPASVPAVHHHPAAILLKGKKGGEDMFCTVAFYSHTPIDDYRYLLPHRELVPSPLPQVINHQGHPASHPGVHQTAGHHPSHGGVVTVIPGMSVVPVSPVQQSQTMEEENGDTIQFGSVDHPLAVQSQHHIQPHHHINGTPFCAAETSPVAPAPDPDAMFEDREFDFFQDDLLLTTPSAAPSATTAPTVPAPLTLHPDPAVVHVQTATSGGTPSLVGHTSHASLNAHYQQLLQMQQHHLGPQQQLHSHHHPQQPHLHNNGGSGQLQQPRQQQSTGGAEANGPQRQKQATVEGQKVEGHSAHQSHMGQQHQPQGHHNNGHHHRHERDNRRSPRDNNNRGDHEGQQQQHKTSNNSGYYRGINGGGNHGNQGGHKGAHYGDSSGRNNWSDNRRGGENNSNNSNRGNTTWNNRNDRSGYNNGPRHHGNNGNGYGNRNGGMMSRREQTAQRV